MMRQRKPSPYESDGRLADVIAAVTVLAAHRDSEMEIVHWVRQLSKTDANRDPAATEIKRWTTVFSEHPEFFMVYELKSLRKAALRLRYANKTIDRLTLQEPPNLGELSAAERGELTSKPLDAAAVNNLVSAAINMHAVAMARNSDARFWVQPIVSLVTAFGGALIGAILPHLFSTPAQPAAASCLAPAAVSVAPNAAPTASKVAPAAAP